MNLRRGTPVWELLGTAGKSSTVLRCPCTYPPDRLRGQMLSGMGVPDLRGGLGTSTFYTSAESAAARESEQVVRPRAAGPNVFSTHVIGPRNPKGGGDLHFEFTIKVDSQGHRVILESEGTPKALVVHEGKWSEWLRVKFKLGLLQSMRGMVRFYLQSCEPELALYASPVNFDPQSPLFPISDPPEYAADIAQHIGLYYTTGMVEDHAGLNNELAFPSKHTWISVKSSGASAKR